MTFHDNLLRLLNNNPTPPEVLLYAMEIFQGAAAGNLHGSHIPRPQSPGMHLTNIPVNRGMMAVMRASDHLTSDERMALSWRIMHLGQSVELAVKDGRFSDLIKGVGDHYDISETFLRAYAACPFMVLGEDVLPSLDELARLIAGESNEDNE